jgi:arylsulfatase A-like enzyme
MKNVILLTIDACRKDALGCYSGSELTPFLDSIQDRCVRFNHNYSGGPYTQAGFPAILSSSYYLDFGKIKGTCPPGRVLVSEVLKRQGITCAAFHSNAYLASFFGWNRGWDLYYDSMDVDVSDEQPYIPAWEINKKAAKWLSTQKGKDKQFFLWVHYMDVHEPYIVTPEYLKAVDPSLNLTQKEQFALFKEVILKRDVANKDGIEALRKLYLAKVHEMDAAAKELFGLLEQTGSEYTVIITSDHGDEFDDHGGLSHDGKMYDELVNVPLIIYDSSKKDGRVSEAITSNLDIPPTITHLLGIEPSEKWQGQSLLPLESYDRKGAFAESIDKQGAHEKGNEPEVHMYREGNLKIIYRQGEDSWQLYDLKEDPKEQHDIFGKNTTSEYLIKKIVPRVSRFQKK